MYQGNSRFNELGNGVITEQISVQTQILYNPTTKVARAIFNCMPFMEVPDPAGGSKYIQVGADTDLLEVNFMDKLTDVLGLPGDIDPVTQQPLNISVLGMQILIKRALDKYHNDREAARLQAIADAEAAAAAQEAATQAAIEAAEALAAEQAAEEAAAGGGDPAP